jgi:hypothetical protein
MFCPTKNTIATFLIIINSLFTIISWGQNTIDYPSIVYDTVTIFDTIPVYDTIWEYETVYDTLWVINPGQEDTTINLLHKINPIEIRQVYYSPFTMRYRNLTFPSQKEKNKTPPPDLTTKDKIHKAFDQLKKRPSQLKSYSGQEAKFTLNPNKGKFDPRAFWSGTFSLEGYMGYNYQQTQYRFEPNSLMINSVGDSIKAMPGREYGLRLNYNVYQLTIQTGIGYLQLKEKFNYPYISLEADSTRGAYIADPYSPGDSIWIYQYDTISTPRSSINTHYVIEVPFIFSYALMFGRVQFDLKLGGINQFHIRSKGEIFGDSAIVEDINTNILFTKYNFALYGGAGLQFYVTDHICFGADAFYKYPIKPFCSGLGATFYKQSYGFNFAIRYLF